MDAAAEQFAELCEKYGTDKHVNHHYEYLYSTILARFRRADRPARLLEIGIESGASLRVWHDYIPRVILHGIDIDPSACKNAPPEATVFCGNQMDVEFLNRVVKETGGQFDIIIDDGGHGTGAAETSFGVLWPHLRAGGVYVVEDLEFSCKPSKVQWGKKHGIRTTIEWLFDEVRSRAHRHWKRHTAHDSTWMFCGEACVITKLPEET